MSNTDALPLLRPCFYNGQCPDQCPDLELEESSSRRCASCNHLASLHRSAIIAPTSNPAPAVLQTPSAPRLPQAPPFGERWCSTLSSTRNRLVSEPVTSSAARAEVNAGYRPTTSRSKSMGPKAKGKGKEKVDAPKSRIRITSASLVPIQGIYFVPQASQHLIKVTISLMKIDRLLLTSPTESQQFWR